MNIEWIDGFIAGVDGDAPTAGQWSVFKAKFKENSKRVGWPITPSDNQNGQITKGYARMEGGA